MFRIVFGLLFSAFTLAAVSLPAGTELQIRLIDKISSETDKAGRLFQTKVIAAVMAGDTMAIGPGTEVQGVVKEVKSLDPADPKKGASLLLDFNELRTAGWKVGIAATLVRVDNARETVDADGRIQGIIPADTTTALIDKGMVKLEQKYGGLAGILEAAKGALVKDTDASITYPEGAEMTIKLTRAIEVKPAVPLQLTSFANETALAQLVNRQPFQTYATNPPVKSDITNLMFIGSRESVTAAFSEAGWANAEALSDRSRFKTAQAIIEQRGYKEAPVSILILDDRPPDLVYQKGNNTFAARHHLRIWRSPDDFQGQPVWISSSTHDIGIDFSQQSMTFIHKIDPNIDAERAKVVNDFIFAGRIKSFALVQRPKVPQHAKNATGDGLDTDGAMAVLLLQ